MTEGRKQTWLDKKDIFKKEDWEFHLMMAIDDEDYEAAAFIKEIAGEELTPPSMDEVVEIIAEKLREEGIC